MSDYRTAVLITLDPQHEGGFQKNPHDHANWTGGRIGVGELVGTKYGITTLDMPGVDIEHITVDQAVEYYRENYWKDFYSQIASQLITNKLFDLGVLFGVKTTVKMLQEVLQITVDGVFGPDTLARLNSKVESVTLQAFKTRLVKHALGIGAVNPEEREDVAGWVRRINS